MSSVSARQVTVILATVFVLLCTATLSVHVQQRKPNSRLTVIIDHVQQSITRHVDELYSINDLIADVDKDEDEYEEDDDDDDDDQFAFKEPSTPPASLPSDPYAQYIYQQKLTLNNHGNSARRTKKRRTIVVGDIHGNLEGFDTFLKTIKHDPRKDVLILAGDMVIRGPQSLEVIDKARKLGLKCVRGNHEDKVIRWRGYLDSLSLQEQEILETNGEIDAAGENKGEGEDNGDDEEEEDSNNKIPADLSKESEHYHLARKMTKAQYDYLRSCPLIYTLPKIISVHNVPVHVIHAGIDPRRDILKQTPWVLINIRNVLENGTPLRKKSRGRAWSEVFNSMHRSDKQDFMVVYGHDAGRGLTVNRRSIGIDTGCVYGRHLTGYVVETGEILAAPCPKVAD